MSKPSVRGFPRKFPVRDDFRKPLRYQFVCGLLRLGFNALFAGRRLRIEGAENVPRTGPLLIVANHLSDIDPLLLGAYGQGTMFAMGKREIFEMFPGAAWLVGGCNCFPVDRGGTDRWAFKTALDVLRAKGRLIVFIEGTRALTPGMQRAQRGVGFMLRSSDAAVVPCAIWGTENVLAKHMWWPRRARVTMRYGRPIQGLAATTRDAQQLADRCALEIARLLPAEYRGVYAIAPPPTRKP